jgi:hypothetical protein
LPNEPNPASIIFNRPLHTMKIFPINKFFWFSLMVCWLAGCVTSNSNLVSEKLNPDFSLPTPGHSKVIFMRPGHMAYAVHFGIHDGDTLIGRSSTSEYFAYECIPGHHLFSTSMDNLVYLDADLLPDRIYYVKVEAVMGWWIAAVKMTPLYPGCKEMKWEKLPHIAASLEQTTITDEQIAHDRKGIAGYLERLKSYQDRKKGGGTILPEYGQASPLNGI